MNTSENKLLTNKEQSEEQDSVNVTSRTEEKPSGNDQYEKEVQVQGTEVHKPIIDAKHDLEANLGRTESKKDNLKNMPLYDESHEKTTEKENITQKHQPAEIPYEHKPSTKDQEDAFPSVYGGQPIGQHLIKDTKNAQCDLDSAKPLSSVDSVKQHVQGYTTIANIEERNFSGKEKPINVSQQTEVQPTPKPVKEKQSIPESISHKNQFVHNLENTESFVPIKVSKAICNDDKVLIDKKDVHEIIASQYMTPTFAQAVLSKEDADKQESAPEEPSEVYQIQEHTLSANAPESNFIRGQSVPEVVSGKSVSSEEESYYQKSLVFDEKEEGVTATLADSSMQPGEMDNVSVSCPLKTLVKEITVPKDSKTVEDISPPELKDSIFFKKQTEEKWPESTHTVVHEEKHASLSDQDRGLELPHTASKDSMFFQTRAEGKGPESTHAIVQEDKHAFLSDQGRDLDVPHTELKDSVFFQRQAEGKGPESTYTVVQEGKHASLSEPVMDLDLPLTTTDDITPPAYYPKVIPEPSRTSEMSPGEFSLDRYFSSLASDTDHTYGAQETDTILQALKPEPYPEKRLSMDFLTQAGQPVHFPTKTEEKLPESTHTVVQEEKHASLYVQGRDLELPQTAPKDSMFFQTQADGKGPESIDAIVQEDKHAYLSDQVRDRDLPHTELKDSVLFQKHAEGKESECTHTVVQEDKHAFLFDQGRDLKGSLHFPTQTEEPWPENIHTVGNEEKKASLSDQGRDLDLPLTTIDDITPPTYYPKVITEPSRTSEMSPGEFSLDRYFSSLASDTDQKYGAQESSNVLQVLKPEPYPEKRIPMDFLTLAGEPVQSPHVDSTSEHQIVNDRQSYDTTDHETLQPKIINEASIVDSTMGHPLLDVPQSHEPIAHDTAKPEVGLSLAEYLQAAGQQERLYPKNSAIKDPVNSIEVEDVTFNTVYDFYNQQQLLRPLSPESEMSVDMGSAVGDEAVELDMFYTPPSSVDRFESPLSFDSYHTPIQSPDWYSAPLLSTLSNESERLLSDAKVDTKVPDPSGVSSSNDSRPMSSSLPSDSWNQMEHVEMLSKPRDARQPEGKHMPPAFRRPLPRKKIYECNTLVVIAEVVGFPIPSINWYRNNTLIEKDHRVKIEREGNMCILQIYNVNKLEEGTYMCHAINVAGEAKSLTQVDVLPQDGQMMSLPSPVTHQHVIEFDLEQATTSRSPSPQEILLEVELDESEVKEFEKQVKIITIPEFTADNKSMIISLDVLPLWLEEQNVLLATKEHDNVKIEVEVTELPPRFLFPVRDLQVVEHAEAKFRCSVAGLPSPNITWHKEHQLITPQIGKYVLNAETENYSLTIQNVCDSDSGTYVCKAENSFGEVTCRGSLAVLQPQATVAEATVEDKDVEMCSAKEIQQDFDLAVNAAAANGSQTEIELEFEFEGEAVDCPKAVKLVAVSEQEHEEEGEKCVNVNLDVFARPFVEEEIEFKAEDSDSCRFEFQLTE